MSAAHSRSRSATATERFTRSGRRSRNPVAHRRPDTTPTMDALEAGQRHQPGDPLAATAEAQVAEFDVNARHAIGPAAVTVDLADPAGQLDVPPCPRRWRTLRPGPVAARGDPEHTTTSSAPGSSPSLARRSGTPSRGPVGLPCEEGRGFLQDLLLDPEGPVIAAQASELRPLVVHQAGASPGSISAWSTQRRSDSLAMPRSCATERRSGPVGGQGGRHQTGARADTVVFLVACGLPLLGLDAPTVGCPRNRVNSTHSEMAT